MRGNARLPKPLRLPSIRQSTSADQPEVMCTTVPPAKSIALIVALGVPHAVHQAVDAPDHVRHREVDDEHPRDMNSMIAEYFMRSAIAPTISAGVMIANISWYIENTFCETQAA